MPGSTGYKNVDEKSDEQKDQDKVPPTVRPPFYLVLSTVRGRNNRTQRTKAPGRQRFKQHVLREQLRLIRNRAITISEVQLLDNLDELLEKSRQGILEVRTAEGRQLIDLEMVASGVSDADKKKLKRPGSVVPEAAIQKKSPPPALPNPPLDSAARDYQGGEFIPPFEGAEKTDTSIPTELEASSLMPEDLEAPPPEGGTPGIPPSLDQQSKGEEKKGKKKEKGR